MTMLSDPVPQIYLVLHGIKGKSFGAHPVRLLVMIKNRHIDYSTDPFAWS